MANQPSGIQDPLGQAFDHVSGSPSPEPTPLVDHLPLSLNDTKPDRTELQDMISLGEPQPKKAIDIIDALALIASLACFAVSMIALSPRLPVPWSLGLKRQLQILGLTLNGMTQCLKAIYPRLLLTIEARYGKSFLQNYDAILRSSIVLSHTAYLWRIVLLAFILLPTGLSVAYKQFIQGSTDFKLDSQGGYYGLSTPGLLASVGHPVGTSIMANATLPFMVTASNDLAPPSSQHPPQAYGFNILLLNNTYSALLDAPMPDYISSIQQSLEVGETRTLNAKVRATMTHYDPSAESHRSHDSFWDYYLRNQANNTGGITSLKLYKPLKQLNLVVSNLAGDHLGPTVDASWCFMALTPDDARNDTQRQEDFESAAMMFITRREMCHGTWSVTSDSIQLIDGSCQYNPFNDGEQYIISHNTLDMAEYYMPILLEYLGSFAGARNGSQWLMPTFTTVIAAMYWSRITALNGYYAWGPDKTVDYSDTNPNNTKRTMYYHVDDEIVSTKPTMDPSWLLYLVLAIQPVLTAAAFLVTLFFHRTPMNRGFSMIAVMAGVKHESLHILKGASFSGQLSKPVKLKIEVDDAVTTDGKRGPPKIDYIIDGEGPNDSLSGSSGFRMPFFRPQRTGTGIGSVGTTLEDMGSKLRNRRGTEYELISRS